MRIKQVNEDQKKKKSKIKMHETKQNSNKDITFNFPMKQHFIDPWFIYKISAF